jgi:Zn-dependent protease with chaperone function
VTERPGVVFGLLLTGAALVTMLVSAGLAGLAGLGGTGIIGLGALAVGSFWACVLFLHELPWVPLSAFAFVALTGASGLAFVRVLRASVRQQRLLRDLPLEPIDHGSLVDVARAAGVRGVFLAPTGRPDAFCFGLLRPRIVVTAGLLARLDPEEQAAAVWHESRHARSREPLKCLVARLATTTFFWIPALRDLLDRYLLAKELAADRLACDRTSTRALAGALSEVIEAEAATPAAAVGISEFAAARVDRLFDPAAKLPPLFRRSRSVVSALALAALVLLLLFPARVDQTAHLRSMLTTMSLHGLPGMTVGVLVNLAGVTLLGLIARGIAKRSSGS